jgi:hypothetical protein
MQFLTWRVSLLKRLKVLLGAVVVLAACPTIQAQVSSARISVLSLDPAKVRVEFNGSGDTSWSFRNTYATVVGLAERIENFRGHSLGREVPVRKLAPGEFRFPEAVTQVSYDVLLNPPAKRSDLSHVSWLRKEYGLLMLGDLLPTGINTTPGLVLDFELPPHWLSASSQDSEGQRYLVSNPEQAVFVVASSLRKKTTKVGTAEIGIVTVGDWPFSDSEVSKIVMKIVAEYTRVLRHAPPGKAAVLLVPFDGVIGPERWSAETRGRDVTLLMGQQAKPGALLARLRVVLAHELFHLWVPNGLTLQGDYDWFFEGFTLYQALLTGLRLQYISFEVYLQTLSRVYVSYRSSTERDKLSLLEASERRWTASSSLVYDKGALVAFIYDLMLRRNSAGRETVSDIYPVLMQEGQGSRQDANGLLSKLLDRRQGLDRFSEEFVGSAAEIDLATFLTPFGLEVAGAGSNSRIQVSKNINKEQRQLLKQLGFKK